MRFILRKTRMENCFYQRGLWRYKNTKSLNQSVERYKNLPFYKDLFFNESTYAAAMLVAIGNVLKSEARTQLVTKIVDHSQRYLNGQT